jgi:DNA polymerase epsilon subunit 1
MDEFVTCSSAFRQLKQLVQKCVNDVMSGDEYADHILSHIYKWISSPTGAKLYDPLLHRLIHKLMQKNFF